MKQTGPSSTPPRLGGAPRSEKEASSTGSCSSTGVRTSSTVRPCWVLRGRHQSESEHGGGTQGPRTPQPQAQALRSFKCPEMLFLSSVSHVQTLLNFLPKVSSRESGLGKLGRLCMCVCMHTHAVLSQSEQLWVCL